MNSFVGKYEDSSLVCGFHHCLQIRLQYMVLLLPHGLSDAFIHGMPLHPSLLTP